MKPIYANPLITKRYEEDILKSHRKAVDPVVTIQQGVIIPSLEVIHEGWHKSISAGILNSGGEIVPHSDRFDVAQGGGIQSLKKY